MLELITAGLALGAVGSFHCIGMCGPLALSLPVNSQNHFGKFVATLSYNLGRVTTYSLLGLLFGLLGQSVAFFGFQQIFSIIIGAIILLFLFLGKKFANKHVSVAWIDRFFTVIRRQLGELYKRGNASSSFLIGILNGLLPCGLVYMAIAGALATANITGSMLFMAAFGLGTLPVMWAVSFLGNYVTMGIRLKIRKLYPVIMAMMACLLILRGLGLGIPYVSPKWSSEKKETVNCGINH